MNPSKFPASHIIGLTGGVQFRIIALPDEEQGGTVCVEVVHA